MSEVLYPRYRAYIENRVELNDAIMALLAGSRLAGHTLSLTVGSEATLSELFPAVQHIRRFNLRSDVARELLNNADHYFASLALPYTLAVHEDFVMSTLDWLAQEGVQVTENGKPLRSWGRIRAWNMHEILFESLGEFPPEEWLQSFHVLRETRNCIIHAGGVIDDKLRGAIKEMGSNARSGWKSISLGTPEDIEKEAKVLLTAEHIFLVLAVTKHLGREINRHLQIRLGKPAWARIVVKDFQASTSKVPHSSSWRRALIGYARHRYGGIGLSAAQLEAAARAAGLWKGNADQ